VSGFSFGDFFFILLVGGVIFGILWLVERIKSE